MTRIPPATALVVMLLAATAGCGNDGASTAPSVSPQSTVASPRAVENPAPLRTEPARPPPGAVTPPPPGDPYAAPAPPPPAEPGTIVWAQPVAAPAGARAWRVLYHSRSIADRDIAV